MQDSTDVFMTKLRHNADRPLNDEDRLDWQENQQRPCAEVRKTDAVLLGVYGLTLVLLVTACLLA